MLFQNKILKENSTKSNKIFNYIDAQQMFINFVKQKINKHSQKY